MVLPSPLIKIHFNFMVEFFYFFFLSLDTEHCSSSTQIIVREFGAY